MRMGREEQRAGWSPELQSLAAQTPSISRCKKKKFGRNPGELQQPHLWPITYSLAHVCH